MADEKPAAKETGKETEADPNKRSGTPKDEDVAAEAVTDTGEPAKIDDFGRPETHENYGQEK